MPFVHGLHVLLHLLSYDSINNLLHQRIDCLVLKYIANLTFTNHEIKVNAKFCRFISGINDIIAMRQEFSASQWYFCIDFVHRYCEESWTNEHICRAFEALTAHATSFYSALPNYFAAFRFDDLIVSLFPLSYLNCVWFIKWTGH